MKIIKETVYNRIFTEKKSFALNLLDVKLRRYIKKRRGFFVEAGANDGIRKPTPCISKNTMAGRDC
jgi:hypothetical protein